MKKAAENPVHVEVVPARPEQQTIMANLLELYAHDFSEFHDVAIGADGRFGYEPLRLYWSEPGRYPFLVWVDGKLAGFVLVKRGSEFSGSEDIWDMAEFFVLRGYRRRGIGTQVGHVGGSRDAVECRSATILGSRDREFHGNGVAGCSRTERWKVLEGFLV
ncbi:MAG TPA: GNAT family N-acetyltransferase [Terriglobales bacterium]|nr:GNAT family N-acetyltransferase [Terriglobales bacterium]